MFRKFGFMLFAAMMVLALIPAGANAGKPANPGNQGRGDIERGTFQSIWAYDANGDDYFIAHVDENDGSGTVGSIAELDQATLTVCEYENQYSGEFGEDGYQDNGWMSNHIHCTGYDGNSTAFYLIVHETDPRYRGNPDMAVWGEWEYHVQTFSGEGNQAKPMKASGNLGN